MLSDNDIVQIAKRIALQFAPMVVGTFGSYATGLARDRSDLDLFVIKQLAHQSHLRRDAVRRLLGSRLYAIDIHVFTAETFEHNALERLSFEWVIARQARLYYHTADAFAHVPSLFENVAAHGNDGNI